LPARFRYQAEQGREEGPVCPVQLQTVGLPPLQDGDLVAQDQDFCGLPPLLTPRQPQPRGDSRDQEEDEPQAHDR
jgi:hypothetical protein